MMPTYKMLKDWLTAVLADKMRQGCVTAGLLEELGDLPDNYERLMEFGRRLESLPIRDDWPYVEPDELEEIRAESDPQRAKGTICQISLDKAQARVRTAFLGSVCGCVLGKPLEVNPSLREIREALEAVDQWPLRDYISEEALERLGRRHGSWHETVRGKIRYVAPDDDINYTILGMMVLEKYGLGFTKGDLRDLWIEHLPIGITFGPERQVLLKAGMATLSNGDRDRFDEWVSLINSENELCGAVIRADAYGYACPGNPELASELAWKDSSFTHRKTGIYGTMFIAAAISLAQVTSDRMEIFERALQYIPRRSRFHEIISDCLHEVKEASDWLEGYERIHGKYSEFCHCRVYQEVGTLMNTLKFAEDVWDGVCKQVSQGNDTDSFGATAGSILGAYFGPEGLDPKRLECFNDNIHTGMALFFESSLSILADRMGRLPGLTR